MLPLTIVPGFGIFRGPGSDGPVPDFNFLSVRFGPRFRILRAFWSGPVLVRGSLPSTLPVRIIESTLII